MDSSGGSKGEVLCRTGVAQGWVNLLKNGSGFLKSSIRLDTKILLYKTCIVPVLIHDCET